MIKKFFIQTKKKNTLECDKNKSTVYSLIYVLFLSYQFLVKTSFRVHLEDCSSLQKVLFHQIILLELKLYIV